MEYILGFLVIVLIGFLVKQNTKVVELNKEIKDKEYRVDCSDKFADERHNQYQEVLKQLTDVTEKFKSYQHSTKSRDVKFGLAYENLAPFLHGFPYNLSDIRGLYNPLDIIVFNIENDELVLVELKSNGAKESAKQKQIKDIIRRNKVYYESHRLDHNGLKIDRQENVSLGTELKTKTIKKA